MSTKAYVFHQEIRKRYNTFQLKKVLYLVLRCIVLSPVVQNLWKLIANVTLTLVMLNKLKCHTHFSYSSNQIT